MAANEIAALTIHGTLMKLTLMLMTFKLFKKNVDFALISEFHLTSSSISSTYLQKTA